MLSGEHVSLNYIKKEEYKASYQGMRYMFRKEEEGMSVFIWPGPYCFEKTEEGKKESRQFPMTEEGKAEAFEWLRNKYEEKRELWTKSKGIMNILL